MHSPFPTTCGVRILNTYSDALMFFSEKESFENSEEIENGTYDESGPLNDFGYSEVEYVYEEVDNQGYEE